MVALGASASGYADQLVDAILRSPLWSTQAQASEQKILAHGVTGLDVAWYFRTHGNQLLSCSPAECASHYLRNVVSALVSPNLAFDEFWYRRRYPEVDRSVNAREYASGWDHYLTVGFRSGYNPVFWFDEAWYQKSQPGLPDEIRRGAIRCGFEHYLLHGIREDSAPSIYFDPAWYRGKYMAANATGARNFPIVHFVLSSAKLNHCPVPFFDELWYKEQYLKTAPVNEPLRTKPFEHYMVFGRRLAYSPSPYFDERAYRDKDPVIETKISRGEISSGFEHYVTRGVLLGMTPPDHFKTGGVDHSGPAFLREYEKSLRLNLRLYVWLRDLVEDNDSR